MNRRTKGFVIGLLVALLFVASVVPAAAATKPKLSCTAYTAVNGQYVTIKLTTGTKKAVKWSTSKKSVAGISKKYKVSGGSKCKISCKKAGKAYIKAKYKGKTYKCLIIVNKLGTPTVKVSNGLSSNNVTWTKVKGATGYKVYRKAGSGKYVLKKTIKSGSTVSFTDKSYSDGSKYVYAVKATRGKYSGAYAYRSHMRLSMPSLKVSRGYEYVGLSWSKVKGATEYWIYQKSGESFKLIERLSGNSTTSYRINYSSCPGTRTFCVKAVNGSFASACQAGAKTIAAGHVLDVGKVLVPYTCTSKGYKYDKCKFCEYYENKKAIYEVRKLSSWETKKYSDGEKTWEEIPGARSTDIYYSERECTVHHTKFYRPQGTGNPIVDEAISRVGSPYFYNGKSYTTGVDCSHFVQKVLNKAIQSDDGKEGTWYGESGKVISASKLSTYEYDYHRSMEWYKYGKKIADPNDIKPGDVISFDGHVIFFMGYIEGKATIIHASGGMNPGGVQITSHILKGNDYDKGVIIQEWNSVNQIISYYHNKGDTFLGISRFYEAPEPAEPEEPSGGEPGAPTLASPPPAEPVEKPESAEPVEEEQPETVIEEPAADPEPVIEEEPVAEPAPSEEEAVEEPLSEEEEEPEAEEQGKME